MILSKQTEKVETICFDTSQSKSTRFLQNVLISVRLHFPTGEETAQHLLETFPHGSGSGFIPGARSRSGRKVLSDWKLKMHPLSLNSEGKGGKGVQCIPIEQERENRVVVASQPL